MVCSPATVHQLYTVYTVTYNAFSVFHCDSRSISNPKSMLQWGTLSFFIFSQPLSPSSFLSLCLSFPLSGGLPVMSPWLLLRCCGALSAFRRMLGRFLLSGGCRPPWPSCERQPGRTVPKRWSDPSESVSNFFSLQYIYCHLVITIYQRNIQYKPPVWGRT